MDALLESRLGALRERVDAFFAAGGVVRGKDGDGAAPRDVRGGPNPRKTQQQLRRLAIDASQTRRLPGGIQERPVSGFKRRNEVAFGAVDLLDKLSGGSLRSRIKEANPNTGKDRDNRRVDAKLPFGKNSLAVQLDQRTRRQLNKQRERDSKVADTAAKQRNALARRRNLSLTPGTRTQLRSSSAGLFSEQRRGVIL